MEEILAWVKSGLLFGVFASVILMLAPNKSYQKHIGLVVGLLFILVMMHPVMEFFHLDSSTYISYIRNFLMIENRQEDLNEENIALYEEAVGAQLKVILQENGYPVKEVLVEAEGDGRVSEVRLFLNGDIEQLEVLEKNLNNLFGEEVRVSYEIR